MKGRIKLGANVYQDFKFFVWPGAEKDPNVLFDIKWEDGNWDCTADGYGVHGCGKYGNGGITVGNRDGVEVVGMSQDSEKMYYVAVDREKPDTAWARIWDDPDSLNDTAYALAGWIKRGAIVMRVSATVAREMWGKYSDKRDL